MYIAFICKMLHFLHFCIVENAVSCNLEIFDDYIL